MPATASPNRSHQIRQSQKAAKERARRRRQGMPKRRADHNGLMITPLKGKADAVRRLALHYFESMFAHVIYGAGRPPSLWQIVRPEKSTVIKTATLADIAKVTRGAR